MHNDNVWWYVFVLAFVATALVETFRPRCSLSSPTPQRWTSNFVLFVLSGATLAFAAIALAFLVRSASFGVLNRLGLPGFVQFVVGFAALDLASYAHHRLLHVVAPLWRAHMVHHSETDLDLTTGFRFHPLETFFRQCLSLPMIALLGVPPGAVGLSKLVIIVQDLLQHANLHLPASAERVLRLLFATPALHRTHHSEVISEQNTNFGTIFSIWDRCFGTYQEGFASHGRCGLAELPRGSELSAVRLLALPFRRSPGLVPALDRTVPPADEVEVSSTPANR